MIPTMLAAFALAVVPAEHVLESRVDAIELNHFYDENGRHVFDQLIFWEWCDGAGRFHVVAWRLVKTVGQVPIYDARRGGYATLWIDGERFRRVRSGGFVETWTQYDRELTERKALPRESRRELPK